MEIKEWENVGGRIARGADYISPTKYEVSRNTQSTRFRHNERAKRVAIWSEDDKVPVLSVW